MTISLLTLILFTALVFTIFTGLPLSFALCGVASLFLLWQLGPQAFFLLPATAISTWTSFVFVAIPLFVLMAHFLASSGVADDLYDTMYKWTGGLRGGLAAGTVIICAIFAAMAGISGVATVSMGLIALPSMLKRNYDTRLAVGCIATGGTLGVLIPPSIVMILYGSLTGESIGKLFIGGVVPGIIVTILFCSYILIRSFFQPYLCPALPKEERASWKEKLRSLNTLLLPLVLIILVLGVIYGGICTPTEASGIGAFGALLVLLIRRRLTWKTLHDSAKKTLYLTCMIMWIVLGAKLFSHVYYAIGAPDFVVRLITGFELNRWIVIILIQLIILVLGMFLDPFGIMVITLPVFIPIIVSLGFDPLWFGILFTMNMEVGYITPPFGFNLFIMKGVVPEWISMADILRSVIPFFFLTLLAMALIMIFPELALWLPGTSG
jgi:tripartite ATP-independent transporter DctM subunit